MEGTHCELAAFWYSPDSHRSVGTQPFPEAFSLVRAIGLLLACRSCLYGGTGNRSPGPALAADGSLATWTGEAGDAAGARDPFAALLPVHVGGTGPRHPDTLAARAQLARWTWMAGDAAEARGRGPADSRNATPPSATSSPQASCLSRGNRDTGTKRGRTAGSVVLLGLVGVLDEPAGGCERGSLVELREVFVEEHAGDEFLA